MARLRESMRVEGAGDPEGSPGELWYSRGKRSPQGCPGTVSEGTGGERASPRSWTRRSISRRQWPTYQGLPNSQDRQGLGRLSWINEVEVTRDLGQVPIVKVGTYLTTPPPAPMPSSWEVCYFNPVFQLYIGFETNSSKDGVIKQLPLCNAHGSGNQQARRGGSACLSSMLAGSHLGRRKAQGLVHGLGRLEGSAQLGPLI